MVLISSFTCAAKMVVVLLTKSNHHCIFPTYINIFLSVKEQSVVFSCVVEDKSKQDLMVLVRVH